MDLEKHKQRMEKLGFSRNEASVYITLANIGSAKAGKLSKEASMDRSSTYNALKSLIEKGLVSYVTIGKIKWFQCSNPKNILSYVNNRVELAKQLVPDVDKLRKETKLPENVRLFKGHKGVKTVFEDILQSADENLLFGSEGQFSKNMPLYEKQFKEKLKKNHVRIRRIMRMKGDLSKKDRDLNIRKIPSGVESPVTTNIYGDKIAIIVWSNVPEAILIENKKAADAYKDYFEFMWKHAEK